MKKMLFSVLCKRFVPSPALTATLTAAEVGSQLLMSRVLLIVKLACWLVKNNSTFGHIVGFLRGHFFLATGEMLPFVKYV